MLKKEIVPPLILGIAITSLYLCTIPPTVYWQDAGIYLTGIMVEGNIYSPGYPFYLILQNIWTHLIPVGTFAQKVHAASALFSGVMSVILYNIVNKLLDKENTLFYKKEASQKAEIPRSKKIMQNSIAVFGVIFMGLNFNIWAQAINAEVYSLHSLLFTIILYLIFKIGKNGKIEKNSDPKTINNIIYMGLVYGLSIANHPMTVLLIPVFIYLVVFQKNILFHSKKLILAALVALIVGLGSYIYLPIVANTHPALNWGNPNTISRFTSHITGKAYVTGEQSFVLNDVSRYKAAAQEFLWEFGWSGLILVSLGAILLYKKDKHATLIFGLIAITHIIFAIFYKQTTEYNSWLIPTHIVFGLFLTYGVYKTLCDIREWKNSNSKLKAITTVNSILIVLFLLFLIPHWMQVFKELNRREYYYAEDFGRNILRELDRNSLVLMTGDQESSTTMYLQSVLGFRKDIILLKNIESEEFTYQEGREDLRIRYPSLNIPEDQFKNLTDLEDQNAVLNKVIESNISTKSIYLMSKNSITLDQPYNLTPAAVMWKLSLEPANIELKYWDFQYHDPQFYTKKERPLMSLKDQSKPGGVNRVPFIQHMINFELQAWKNLGDWYIQQNECDKAEQAYSKMKKVQSNILEELSSIPESVKKCRG
jgi:hypothetical protein